MTNPTPASTTERYEIPRFLTALVGVSKEPVAAQRPKDNNADEDRPSDFDRLMGVMQDAIHGIVNNTCRAAGVDFGDADSEQTWAWVKTFGEKIEEFIREEWTKQDDEKKRQMEREAEDYRMLNDYLARVNRARAAAGLPNLVVEKLPPKGLCPI